MASDGSMHQSLSAAQAHEQRLSQPTPQADPTSDPRAPAAPMQTVTYRGQQAFITSDGVTHATIQDAQRHQNQIGRDKTYTMPTAGNIGTAQGHGRTIYVAPDGSTHASPEDARNYVHQQGLHQQAAA